MLLRNALIEGQWINKVSTHLSKDDATGLINVIDHYASAAYGRQDKEWSSLDDTSKDKYKNGKRVGSDQENHIMRDMTMSGKRWAISNNPVLLKGSTKSLPMAP